MPALFIPPGSGQSVRMGGLAAVFKWSGTHTGGAFSVVEHPIASATLGAPLRTHTHEDEPSYILEGEVTFRVVEDLIHAPAGSSVFKPRGIPHAF